MKIRIKEIFKMVKRNISFFERKKSNYYKNMNSAQKEKFIL